MAVAYIGIDPGSQGGLACLLVQADSRREQPIATKMPGFDKEIYDWIISTCLGCSQIYAAIEKVTGWIGPKFLKTGDEAAHGGQPGSAMFKFGASFGALRMALSIAEIPFDEVYPQTWQPAVGVAKKQGKETQSQRKNRVKSRALELFDSSIVTLATCDALLLAYYCRLKNKEESRMNRLEYDKNRLGRMSRADIKENAELHGRYAKCWSSAPSHLKSSAISNGFSPGKDGQCKCVICKAYQG